MTERTMNTPLEEIAGFRMGVLSLGTWGWDKIENCLKSFAVWMDSCFAAERK